MIEVILELALMIHCNVVKKLTGKMSNYVQPSYSIILLFAMTSSNINHMLQ